MRSGGVHTISFYSFQPTVSFEIMPHPAELHHENLLQISNGITCFWKAVVFLVCYIAFPSCSWDFLKIRVQLHRFIKKTSQFCDVAGSRTVTSPAYRVAATIKVSSWISTGLLHSATLWDGSFKNLNKVWTAEQSVMGHLMELPHRAVQRPQQRV